MTAARKRRVEELFHRANELSPEARDSFLAGECADDDTLRREVESLLHQLDADPDYLETLSLVDSVSAQPTMPECIGPYRLLEPIGEGGMGSVYLAEQQAPVRRKVALKIVKLGMDTADVVARFEAERQALALMDHPGVARVFDAGATDTGRPYFVMEHVPGVRITTFCDERQLDIRERLQLFSRVCDAVQHAHQRGIIHRDLKPSNILVREIDGKPAPTVIDFGIAQATGQRLTQQTLHTRVGQLVGTFEYMSPEQADPTADGVDTRTDVYSLGVVLYELLTGTLPSDRGALPERTPADLGRILRASDPLKPSARLTRDKGAFLEAARRRRSDPRALARRLRGDLDWMVLKALHADRRRRYASVSELAADIERHLAHEPVSAGPPGTGYRAAKFVRRNRAFVFAASFVLVSLLAGLAATLTALSEVSAEARRSTQIKDFLVDVLAAGDPMAQMYEPVSKPHVAREIRVREILELIGDDLDQRFATDPAVEVEVQHVIGQACFGLGLWDRAERHLRRAVELGRTEFGEEDERTLLAMSALVRLVYWQAHYKEAIALAAEAVEIARRRLGPEHRTTLRLTAEWAFYSDTYSEEHNYRAILRDTHETCERVYGPNDALTIVARCFSYRSIPSDDQEMFSRETVARARQALGDEHLTTGLAHHFHAQTLHRAGRPADAEVARRAALAAQARHLGEDHPSVIVIRGCLAWDLRDQGRLDEAEAIFVETLDAMERTLGDGSNEIATALLRYGWLLERQGRHDEAADVYRRVLVCREQYLEPGDGPALRGLIRCLWKSPDRQSELEQALRERRAILTDSLGGEDPVTCNAANELARFLAQQGHAAEAESILLASFEALEEGSTERTATLQALVELYTGWGRPAEARRYERLLVQPATSNSKNP